VRDELPKHITDMFDNAHKLPEGKRAGQTKIMQELFDKDETAKKNKKNKITKNKRTKKKQNNNKIQKNRRMKPAIVGF